MDESTSKYFIGALDAQIKLLLSTQDSHQHGHRFQSQEENRSPGLGPQARPPGREDQRRQDELDRLGALIGSITALGTTVLIVEHHLELIARISDQVTVLDRGRVLAAGTPDEVFRHPEVERAYMGREGTGEAR